MKHQKCQLCNSLEKKRGMYESTLKIFICDECWESGKAKENGYTILVDDPYKRIEKLECQLCNSLEKRRGMYESTLKIFICDECWESGKAKEKGYKKSKLPLYIHKRKYANQNKYDELFYP